MKGGKTSENYWMKVRRRREKFRWKTKEMKK